MCSSSPKYHPDEKYDYCQNYYYTNECTNNPKSECQCACIGKGCRRLTVNLVYNNLWLTCLGGHNTGDFSAVGYHVLW